MVATSNPDHSHLNPEAPVFKSKVSNPIIEAQTENLRHEEETQLQDAGVAADFIDQVDERLEDMHDRDTDSEVPAVECAVPEDTDSSFEDGQPYKRHSTRTRQAKCIFTYEELGKPSLTSYKK